MELFFSERFKKDYKLFSDDIKQVINSKLKIISENPLHPSLRTKKIKGREDIFETIKLNKQVSHILKKNNSAFNIFTFIPFSGTKLRDICIEKGYISGNEKIPLSYFVESMLTMPSLSKKEIYALERTSVLYILLPESYYPEIKIAEQHDEEGEQMYNKLIKLIKI